ncbi:hypothetical protein [Nocardioides jensenii]|uniref:hypothetical protein n=1 Tax=Nocardioides jensenii TaxID=1843 RepID=UPI000829C84E|nr:hypothetical protein [Nocardioides jensenii]
MDDQQLADRIDRLEGYAVKVLSAAAAVFLCLGAFRTYYTEKGTDYSVVTTVGLFDEGGAQKVIAAGFLGLVIATAIAVMVCIVAFDRGQGRFAVRAGVVSFWLMAVGSLAPVLVSLIARGSDESSEQAGSAMIHYVAGVALFGLLVLTTVRNLWVRDPELHVVHGPSGSAHLRDHWR